MNITIVGGSGFIGTRLAQRCVNEGHDVTIIDLKQSTQFPDLTATGDVTNYDQLSQTVPCCDVLVNLAAEHRDDVRPTSRYYDVNVSGASHVCRVASKKKIRRIVFTSSVAVYGDLHPTKCENSVAMPTSDYGKSKLQAEAVYKQWAHQSPDRSLLIVRPTVVFGESNRGNLYNLLNAIKSRRFAFVGSGKNVKSIAYVGNLVDFLLFRLNSNCKEELFNYADMPDYTMKDLVLLCSTLMGSRFWIPTVPYHAAMLAAMAYELFATATRNNVSVSTVRVKKFCSETAIPVSKLKNTGFQPRFSIRDGLVRTIQADLLD